MKSILFILFKILCLLIAASASLPKPFYIVKDADHSSNTFIGVKVPPSDAQSTGTTSMLVWTGPIDNQFKNINVEPSSLNQFVFDSASLCVKSIDEVLDDYQNGKPLSSYHYKELTEEEKLYLNTCSKAIVSLGTPEQLLDQGVTENKVRLIGASICHTHGREGMVYTCNFNPKYLGFIERAWDGICEWRS